MAESKLQRSEVVLEATLAKAVITPYAERSLIMVNIGPGYGVKEQKLTMYPLTPEDAYCLGQSLMEHAAECGYDPDTDETT